MTSINAKISLEIEKGYILEQINRIPENYKPNKENLNVFRQTLELVSNNLGSSNAELSYKVNECTTKLLKILADTLDAKTVDHILSKSKPIFSEYKVPSFLRILIPQYPKSMKPYS